MRKIKDFLIFLYSLLLYGIILFYHQLETEEGKRFTSQVNKEKGLAIIILSTLSVGVISAVNIISNFQMVYEGMVNFLGVEIFFYKSLIVFGLVVISFVAILILVFSAALYYFVLELYIPKYLRYKTDLEHLKTLQKEIRPFSNMVMIKLIFGTSVFNKLNKEKQKEIKEQVKLSIQEDKKEIRQIVADAIEKIENAYEELWKKEQEMKEAKNRLKKENDKEKLIKFLDK